MSEQSEQGAMTTRTNPRWMVKTMIFLIVGLALSGWFALDALVIYPNRGRADAQVKLWQYLEQAQQSTQLFTASVSEPKKSLDALSAKDEKDMTAVEKGAARVADFALARRVVVADRGGECCEPRGCVGHGVS
ncbi:MAG: hypothetical protein R3B46_05475 [Phycisphaerales bacterium]